MDKSNSLAEDATSKITKVLLNWYMVPVVSVLLLLIIGVHGVNAQAQYTPPPNENSFPAVAVPSWLDTGSNSWMMAAATFVGLQSIPGLAIYYGGLTRKKFAINTALMHFYGFSMVLVVWVLAGYNFGFGVVTVSFHGLGILGTPSPIGLSEGTQAVVGPANLALNIPTATTVWFQFVFAAITPLLFIGSVIERMSFKAWMILVPLWSFFVYSPLAYWLFAGGWLNQLGAVDFSGGYVIHLDAGISGLAAAMVVGPRPANARGTRPNNLYMVFIGAGLLWLGWNGFNGGDPYGSSIDASIAVMNTDTATAVSAITWMFMDMRGFGKPTLVGAMTGAITGLVAITPAAGYVDGFGAIVIGIASGITPWLAMYKMMPKLKVDDALGVFPGHGIAGITGGILTGILADPSVTQYVDPGLTGALWGNFYELGIQIFAAGVTCAYAFTVTYILLKIIGKITPLQESPARLKIGDMAIHGEVVEPPQEEEGEMAKPVSGGM